MTAILYLHNKTGISGGERSLLNLWRNLDDGRFTPVLAIPGEGPFAEESRSCGAMVEICPVPKITPLNLAAIIKTCSILAALCKKRSIRLIHSYTPRNNLVAWAVSRILRIPVIWHERNLLYGKERDITDSFLSLPDCIICNSNAVAGRFKKNGALPLKVKVVINGVDLAIFRPGPPLPSVEDEFNPHRRRIVGIVSNFERRKGVDVFINIAAKAFKKEPDAHFLVVGGEFGDDGKGRRDELDERIVQAGLGGRVTITGFVSNVHEIIPLFDIGVAVTEKEACSRALLEMMACGKPVVAFDTGGNPELIEHLSTGIMFPFGDTESVADGIVGLLHDPDRAARMGAAARRRAESRFDITINARKTMDLYSRLLKGDGRV